MKRPEQPQPCADLSERRAHKTAPPVLKLIASQLGLSPASPGMRRLAAATDSGDDDDAA